MSAIFQRPLCDMGKAYDFSFRSIAGEPALGTGGGCDERPHRVEMYSATTDPRRADADWRPFSLCTEHESQLRQADVGIAARGLASRFRGPPPGGR